MAHEPGKGPENAWLEMVKKLGSAALEFTEGKGGGLLNLASASITRVLSHFSEKKADLERMENEVRALRKKGDELEAMVRANWTGIKKCGSDEEYLEEERRIAADLERRMTAGNTSNKLEE